MSTQPTGAPAGNILALRLSPDEPYPQNPFNIPYRSGLRAFLAVRTIYALVQTTIFVGNNLYMIHYDSGQLTTEDAFRWFLKDYFNREALYDQLTQPPRFTSNPIRRPHLRRARRSTSCSMRDFDPK